MQNENPLTFQKAVDKQRLNTYKFYDQLYEADHFDAFSIVGEKDFTKAYQRLRYLVANFPGLISRVMADMLFGEDITIDLESDENQKYADNLIEENQLRTQLYESAT